MCVTPVVERWKGHAAELDLLALHELNPARYPFLLESAAQNPRTGRYDLLFAFPQERLWGADALNRIADTPATASARLASENAADCADLPFPDLPFLGGWFLFLPYELAQEIEPSLHGRVPMPQMQAQAVRCPAALIHDHITHVLWLVGRDEEDLAQIRQDIALVARAQTAGATNPKGLLASIHEASAAEYCTQVARILEYIRAGDVFQVNLSRRWDAQIAAVVTPAQLYRRLRDANPAPFAALAVFPEYAIISSSPERLVELRGNQIQTRPIAGTRPRSTDPEQDRALAKELLAHQKEQAEHVMLIDLERNDLGRVAVPGSVEVDEHMVLESYAHVHHIVSNVRAQLRSGLNAMDVIRAVFPGGTITGCPKVRCMEIIGELEQEPRGAYTGSVGYLDIRGNLDLNILIRTLELRGANLHFRTGAGIVSDSIPEAELEETRAKAKGLLRALAAENRDNSTP